MPSGAGVPLPGTPAGTLVRTTLVDFPGRVAAAVFLPGCNLRCPYCHNAALVEPGRADAEAPATMAEVAAHLEKRRAVLTGFVLSGGEPLMHPLAPHLIRLARSLGYRIKLDTNGTMPQKLRALLADAALCPDYVAMDLKTAPARYPLLYPAGHPAGGAPAELLAESVRALSSLPPEHREWRTVLVPGLVTEQDIAAMAALLPPDARWYLSGFRPGGCLDPRMDALAPYPGETASLLLRAARSRISGAESR